MTNPTLEVIQKRWDCLRKYLTPSSRNSVSMGWVDILHISKLLTFDSREVIKNAVWIPVSGSKVDGHDLLSCVEKQNCLILVDAKKFSLPEKRGNSFIIPVRQSEEFFAKFVPEFYGFPSKKMQMIGVTGTNGKTSTSIFIKNLFSIVGKSIGSIGTLGVDFAKVYIESANTTPNIDFLQKILEQMCSEGIKTVVMEMSSHGLSLGRTEGIDLDVAVFTNITQDHLDFHHTLENYLRSKMKILELLVQSSKLKKRFFIWKNFQEKQKVLKFISEKKVDRWEFSVSQNEEDSQIHIQLGRQTIQGTEIQIFFHREKVYEGQFPLLGKYNYENFAAALSVVSFLEQFSKKDLEDTLVAMRERGCLQVPGRLEKIYMQEEKLVIVDYAHTPDALKNVLQLVKQLPHKRILCLFGCGGDRDIGKREKMGEVVSCLSDVVFLTSDNPRTEDPQKIIEMISKGLSSCIKSYQINDRKEALMTAAQFMQPGDILVVAGKGHETYQIIGNDKIPLDDRVVLREFFHSGNNSFLCRK